MMLKTSTVSIENFFENAFKKANIADDRKKNISTIAKAISIEISTNKVVNLNFICTHNARRSQFVQVWSFFAANYFNLNIHAFSGGTEVTTVYRSTIKTLQKIGFEFQINDFSHQNPKYQITFKGARNTLLGFSKLYSNPINTIPFMAITTCNNADKNCPFIPTASHRFYLPFEDTEYAKEAENKEEVNLEINKKIASEIYFLFSEIKKLLS